MGKLRVIIGHNGVAVRLGAWFVVMFLSWWMLVWADPFAKRIATIGPVEVVRHRDAVVLRMGEPTQAYRGVRWQGPGIDFFAGGRWTVGIHRNWLTGVLAVSVGLMTLEAAVVARRYRKRRAVCTNCGYDLRGTPAARCSECGTTVEGRA